MNYFPDYRRHHPYAEVGIIYKQDKLIHQLEKRVYHLEAKILNSDKNICYSQSEFQLIGEFRKLWIDHIVWTRNSLVSFFEGLDDQATVLERLVKNQQNIANSFKPYYGQSILKSYINYYKNTYERQ